MPGKNGSLKGLNGDAFGGAIYSEDGALLFQESIFAANDCGFGAKGGSARGGAIYQLGSVSSTTTFTYSVDAYNNITEKCETGFTGTTRGTHWVRVTCTCSGTVTGT